MRHKLAMLAHDEIDRRAARAARRRAGGGRAGVAAAPELSALEESEREDELGDWLDEHGVSGAWELAPIFVAGGHHDRVPGQDRRRRRAAELLDSGLRWLAYTVETELLLAEITDSVTRISTLVDAAKQYSHMDRAPLRAGRHPRGAQEHAGDAQRQARTASRSSRTSTATLPKVPLYAGELNQVWTNLIDNAVQAMDGHGTLTLRTSLDGRLRARRDRRHRPRHPGRAPAADLRAVLHHQAGRAGHRAGPGHLLPDRRRPARRRHLRWSPCPATPASSCGCR